MKRASFDHRTIEPASREKWEALRLHETNLETAKDPYYLLFEFPYPSGDLHVGHWYAFALTDIYARYLRMQGKGVLFPIGFDSFGLPAENAAMKFGKDPKEWTYANMDRMRSQIRTMGTSVDWSKEIVSSDPDYYKWTQWLFQKFMEHELVERKEAPVKWCPKDATVLANEQVVDGKCERCGTDVEEKRLTQWFMKITAYAERLLTDLDTLPWREDIKEAQRQWIGKSEGAKLSFPLVFTHDPSANDNLGPNGEKAAISVFTTRPDTVFGATYLVLAPDHLWVTLALRDDHSVLANKEEVRAYVDAASKKTERERSENKDKTGVKVEGVVAINPATNKEIPVYVADYVLASYGTGAVMAVPAHDERDHAFAVKHGLPMVTVVEGDGDCFTGDGTLINSGSFTGQHNRDAFDAIITAANGEKTTNYRIRDWLISRQRYWGCPIPVVYDPEGKPHAIPAEHLPWLLPEDVDFRPTGKAPLASSKELQERVTRIFGEGWTPEYDTLDTFVDSSWYFLRYVSPQDDTKFADASLLKKWLPVHRYSGGSEHTTMHLLYARFFHKALYDLALVPTPEPFGERYNRGIILGPDGAKMSKSKGNVVNPDEHVALHGADAVRMYLAFIGPYNEPGHYPWNPAGVESMRRFLDRIYALSERVSDGTASEPLKKALAKATVKVGGETDRFKFNTAISALMVLVNSLEEESTIDTASWRSFLVLLAPYAPHLAEHLYEVSGGEGSIHLAPWPSVDASLLTEESVTVVVQVNSKRRGELVLAPDASEGDAVAAALALPGVAEAMEGAAPARVVYVPGRILNLVRG